MLPIDTSADHLHTLAALAFALAERNGYFQISFVAFLHTRRDLEETTPEWRAQWWEDDTNLSDAAFWITTTYDFKPLAIVGADDYDLRTFIREDPQTMELELIKLKRERLAHLAARECPRDVVRRM